MSNIYVDLTGNDTFGNGSQSMPYATLLKGLAVATAGDTIYLVEGAHTETFPRETGTATGGGVDTLIDAAKLWPVNKYLGFMMWIFAGTGVGQIREIDSNNNTVLKVKNAWSIVPDATSQYALGIFHMKAETDITITSSGTVTFTPACTMDNCMTIQDGGNITIEGIQFMQAACLRYFNILNSSNIVLDIDIANWTLAANMDIIYMSSSTLTMRGSMNNIDAGIFTLNAVNIASGDLTVDGFTMYDVDGPITGSPLNFSISELVAGRSVYDAANLEVPISLTPANNAVILIDLCEFYKTYGSIAISAGANTVTTTIKRYIGYLLGAGIILRGASHTGYIYNAVLDACTNSILVDASTVTVKNVILSNGALLYGLLVNNPLIATNTGTINISYSDFHNNLSTDDATGGTITYGASLRYVNPQYVDALNHDYHVVGKSQMIDTGIYVGLAYSGSAPDIGRYDTYPEYDSQETIQYVSGELELDPALPDLPLDDEEDYIKQKLEDELGLVVEEGNVWYDLFIRTLALMLTPLEQNIDAIRDAQTISKYPTMSSSDLDALASNLAEIRISGTYSYGTVRLYFVTPIDVSIPVDTDFVTSNYTFKTLTTFSTTEEEMSFNISGDYFYFDVVVYDSSKQATSAVVQGTSFSISNRYIPEIVKIEAVADFAAGQADETNTELYNRLPTAVATRQMGNANPISDIMKSQFPAIVKVHSEGKGDTYMERDMIPGIDYHIGGCIDIYIRTNSVLEKYKDILQAAMTINLSKNNLDYLPVLKIKNIERLDPDTLEPTGSYVPVADYTIEILTPNERFSREEQLRITFSVNTYVDLPLRIRYYTITDLLSYQTYASGEGVRVLAANTLVKHFWPAFVTLTLRYEAASELTTLQSSLETYINALEGDNLISSELIDIANGLGAIHVELPYSINAEMHKNDGTIINYVEQDEIDFPVVAHPIAYSITVERM